jgi:hypothetical protein
MFVLISLFFILGGCSISPGVAIGYSPTGIPFILKCTEEGMCIEYDGHYSTPIGTFYLKMDFPEIVPNPEKHSTYIQVYDRENS